MSRMGWRDAVTTMAPPFMGSTATRSELPCSAAEVVNVRVCGLSPGSVAIAATTGASCGATPPGFLVALTGSNTHWFGVVAGVFLIIVGLAIGVPGLAAYRAATRSRS